MNTIVIRCTSRLSRFSTAPLLRLGHASTTVLGEGAVLLRAARDVGVTLD